MYNIILSLFIEYTFCYLTIAFSSTASISSPIHPVDEISKSNNTIENQLVQRSEDHEGKILFVIYSNCYRI